MPLQLCIMPYKRIIVLLQGDIDRVKSSAQLVDVGPHGPK